MAVSNLLTRKLGPLKTWQWAAIGGGAGLAYYYYKSRKSGSSATGANANPTNAIDPATGMPYSQEGSAIDPNTGVPYSQEVSGNTNSLIDPTTGIPWALEASMMQNGGLSGTFGGGAGVVTPQNVPTGYWLNPITGSLDLIPNPIPTGYEPDPNNPGDIIPIPGFGTSVGNQVNNDQPQQTTTSSNVSQGHATQTHVPANHVVEHRQGLTSKQLGAVAGFLKEHYSPENQKQLMAEAVTNPQKGLALFNEATQHPDTSSKHGWLTYPQFVALHGGKSTTAVSNAWKAGMRARGLTP